MTGARTSVKARRAEPAALDERNAEKGEQAAELEKSRAEVAELTERLAEMRLVLQNSDRDLLEMRTVLRETERQLAAIRKTFTYRLGDALMGARSLKGLAKLPGRLAAMRRDFRQRKAADARKAAKANRRTNTRVLADHLQYVDETLARLRADGMEAAAEWVRAQPENTGRAKGRALAELAVAAYPADAETAMRLGLEALTVSPGEVRLRSLIFALFDRGDVTGANTLLEAARKAEFPATDQPRLQAIEALARMGRKPIEFPSVRPVRARGETVAIVTPRSLPQHAEALTYRVDRLAGTLAAAGRDAFVVTEPGYQYPKAGASGPFVTEGPGRPIVRLPATYATRQAIDQFVEESASALEALFAARGVGVVHAMADPVTAAAAATAARRHGARLVLDLGEIPSFGGPPGPVWEATERFQTQMQMFLSTLAVADRILVRSHALAERLKASFGVEAHAVIVDVPPAGFLDGADAPATPPPPLEDGIDLSGRTVVGVFEALDDDPGHLDLLAAFARVRKKDPKAALVFLGSGRGAQGLRKAAADAGLGASVIVPRRFPRLRAPDYVRSFNVAVFPRRFEHAVGYAAPFELQAVMAAGVPVVAADTDWTREWVEDGATGALVPAGDRTALLERVAGALRRGPAVVRQADAARARVAERASPAGTAEAYAELLAGLD